MMQFALIVPVAPAATLAETVAQIKKSVVGIVLLQPTRNAPAQLIGTGFAVADGHYIMTNYHVVRQHDPKAGQLLFADVLSGGTYIRRNVQIVAVAPDYDLALLRLDGGALPAVKLRMSDDLVAEGNEIAMTGFPIGFALGLTPATSRGIVSALTLNRSAEPNSATLDANRVRAKRYLTYQLDIIAYPGNSGGPVYASDTGEVCAIVSSGFIRSTKERVFSDPSAITYAIPSRYAVQLLIENGLTP